MEETQKDDQVASSQNTKRTASRTKLNKIILRPKGPCKRRLPRRRKIKIRVPIELIIERTNLLVNRLNLDSEEDE